MGRFHQHVITGFLFFVIGRGDANRSGVPISGERQVEMMLVISSLARKRELDSGVVVMGEIIRFVPRSELERARLIREARAIYDSIFPPADSATQQREPRK